MIVAALAFSLTASFTLATAGMAHAAEGSEPGTFVSLDPARILDTRVGNGAPQAPVGAYGTVSLQVTDRGGVPATDVAAVVVNVTVTASSTAGFITVYPSGTSMPTASNLNFTAGQNIPNLVTVKVGADGKINLANWSAGTAHLIADVAGYYRAGTATVPGAFVSLDPSRVLDTRVGNGAPKAPVGAYGTVGLQVTGRGGVPQTGVAAVVVNVTVTASSAAGFITVYPFGTSMPTASNLNFTAGQNIPNLVTVKVGTDGKIDLTNWSAGTAHLIADVAGYYLAGTATAPGAFVSLDPSRLLDTRIGNGAAQAPVVADGTVSLQVTDRGGVPSPGAVAVVVNVTVTGPASSGFITVYPFGTSMPTASNLNFSAGQTIPNLVAVKIGGNGKIDLTNNSAGNVHMIADVAGYFIASPEEPSEVWPTGRLFDRCGTEQDGLLLLATPGIVYSPEGPLISYQGESYYQYAPDENREVVVTGSAEPGYVIMMGYWPEWVVTNDDGSLTGTIPFTDEPCPVEPTAG
jgi:hypothetical protein